MSRHLNRVLAPLVVAGALAVAGCGSDGRATDSTGSPRLEVDVAFYPLQFLVQRIGGDAVDVRSLTAPGAEPHDLELSPRQVGRMSKADLVVYLKGFQPAVDDAVAQEAKDHALDVTTTTALTAGYVPVEDGEARTDEPGRDPHVWLDPVRFASVAEAVGQRLAQLDPERATAFAARTAALRADLSALDADYRTGLARCARHELVTSHNAYGYLAARYGLEQVSLTGLTPEEEASPATLVRVARFAERTRVTTIFVEELVSPDVARTLAEEVGARAVALSPLEGPPGTGDYLTQMRVNLTTLQTALGCA